MRNNGAINNTRDHFATGQVWTGFGKSTLNCPDSYGTARYNETTGFTHISREDFARERDINICRAHDRDTTYNGTRRKYSHGTSLGGNEVLCKVERDIKI